MKAIIVLTVLLIVSMFLSCNKKDGKTLIVSNSLPLERLYETVELTKEVLEVKDLSTIGIRDAETDKLQVTQTVDKDLDGVMDLILFQPQIAASSQNIYKIVSITEAEKIKAPELCYSRFVPERTDDYAWENDKVAFRVFGPTAQKMIEQNIAGGTLSSGVDAWLKKVNYPIINKWYKKEVEKTGSYHNDTGEGLDNFHVGVSRGVGGVAVKEDEIYFYSKNFTSWKTIAVGPIRTSFYLEYAPWGKEKQIMESRVVSLDRGSNLTKYIVSVKGTDTVYAGLSLHENDGESSINLNNGWISYWQPHGDSELGSAILAPEETLVSFDKYISTDIDQSNLYGSLKVENNEVTYYAGFGWKKSKQFKNRVEWENYLNNFSLKLNHPLTFTIK